MGSSLEIFTINLRAADNICQEEPSSWQDHIGWGRDARWDRKTMDYLAGRNSGIARETVAPMKMVEPS